MAGGRVSVLMHHVHRLLGTLPDAESDGALVERFVNRRDERAFAALLCLYRPMVWSVCRRVTDLEQDAEDVFQATFLLLARKAAGIRNNTSVGSWLFGVAHRLALRTRTDAARRRIHEKRAARKSDSDPSHDVTLSELRTVLDEELARLQDKFRAPLLLCYFEELTQEEAATQLGWSKRVVKYRLERGRQQLRARLVQRGLTLSGVLIGSMLTSRATSGAVPAVLADATVRLAIPYMLGQPMAGAISARVITLAEGGLKAMIHTKVWSMTAGLLAIVIAIGGASLLLSASDNGSKPIAALVEKEYVDLVGDPLPPGAIARLGTVRFRVEDQGWDNHAVSFMPNGKTIVSASQGNIVQFWDAATGKLLREIHADIPGEVSCIYGFALSPDGKYFAVSRYLAHPKDASPRAVGIGIWDVASGKEFRSLKRDANDVGNCLVFSPDGKLLVSSGGRSGMLIIEDVASGKEIQRRHFNYQWVTNLALSPDGTTLAVKCGGRQAHRLYLWQWQGGELPRELNIPPDRGDTGLAFSSDSKRLAEYETSGSVIRVWKVADGGLAQTLFPPEIDPSVTYSCVVYTPDGKSLVASVYSKNGGAVYQLDAATGRLQCRIDARLGFLCVSPDSALLAGTTGGGACVSGT